MFDIKTKNSFICYCIFILVVYFISLTINLAFLTALVVRLQKLFGFKKIFWQPSLQSTSFTLIFIIALLLRITISGPMGILLIITKQNEKKCEEKKKNKYYHTSKLMLAIQHISIS